MKLFREFEGRLTAQLNDDAFRLFMFDDLPQMFPEDRLKIELVGHVKVGRHGLRVTVDHDGFITAFLDGQQPVHAAIVEFDALPDTVGTAAEYDDLFLVCYLAFVDTTTLESAVEIRGLGLELSRAGVHHFVDPTNAGRLTFLVHLVFRTVLHDLADLFVTEAHVLGFAQQFCRQGVKLVFGDLFFQVDDLLDLEDEPAIDICRLHDALHTDAHHQGVFDAEDAVPFRSL